MFGLFLCAQPPLSFAEVMQCDHEALYRFFHAMLKRGAYLAVDFHRQAVKIYRSGLIE
jgi:glutamate-1-semialdehyde 2,1-aminomutase